MGRSAPSSAKLREFEYANGFFKILPAIFKINKEFQMDGETDMHKAEQKEKRRKGNIKLTDPVVQRCAGAMRALASRLKREDERVTTRQKCLRCEAKEKKECKRQAISVALKKCPRYALWKFLDEDQIKKRYKYLVDEVIKPLLEDNKCNDWARNHCLKHWPLQNDRKRGEDGNRLAANRQAEADNDENEGKEDDPDYIVSVTRKVRFITKAQ